MQSGLSALRTFLNAGGVTHTQLEELKTALEALAEGGDTKEVLDDIYARLADILAKQSSDPATSAKQDTGNNTLSTIENEISLRDLGSETMTGNGASQSATVPANTKAVFITSDYVNVATAFGEDGYTHLGIDKTATVDTSPVVYPRGYVAYGLSDSQTLELFATPNTKIFINYLG